MTGKPCRVVTWDDKQLRLLTGHCTVTHGGVITVTSEYGMRRMPLSGMAPFDLARIILRELAAKERTAPRLDAEVVGRRAQSMPKLAQAADVRILYQGAFVAIEPLSDAGRDWLAATVPDQPPGAVLVPLRYLDEVLSSARQARLTLDVPWDESDAGGD